MFEIDPSDPLSLTMLGGPKETLGEFPMAIAYSSKFEKGRVQLFHVTLSFYMTDILQPASSTAVPATV